MRTLLDTKYTAHDAYAIFSRIMNATKDWYAYNPNAESALMVRRRSQQQQQQQRSLGFAEGDLPHLLDTKKPAPEPDAFDGMVGGAAA